MPALEAASRRVIRSGWFVRGREVEALEGEFARMEGRRAAVGCGNGLDALRLGLHGLGVGPGDEVIVPAVTFAATALAVLQCGATPVVVDVCEGSLLLDSRAVERAMSDRVRAILPVHLYGQMADVDSLTGSLPPEVAILEDAAQAHLARRGGRSPGDGTAGAAYSFYPGKNLGALGDAGALLSDDTELIAGARRYANYGSAERYLHEEIGINSRMDEMQAAFLRVRLAGLPAQTKRRRQIAQRYRNALSRTPGLRLLEVEAGSEPVWHVFPIRIHASKRERVQRELADAGVETLIHYPYSLDQIPALKERICVPRSPEVAHRNVHELLSLPMGAALRDEEVDWVIESLERAMRGAIAA